MNCLPFFGLEKTGGFLYNRKMSEIRFVCAAQGGEMSDSGLGCSAKTNMREIFRGTAAQWHCAYAAARIEGLSVMKKHYCFLLSS